MPSPTVSFQRRIVLPTRRRVSWPGAGASNSASEAPTRAPRMKPVADVMPRVSPSFRSGLSYIVISSVSVHLAPLANPPCEALQQRARSGAHPVHHGHSGLHGRLDLVEQRVPEIGGAVTDRLEARRDAREVRHDALKRFGQLVDLASDPFRLDHGR